MSRETAHFSLWEFACRGTNCCAHTASIDYDLIYLCEAIRDQIGQPITVNSGFRCNKHNFEERGSSGSRHTLGLAADLALPRNADMDHFIETAQQVLEEYHTARGAIIVYDWGIHVDIRDEKHYFDDRRTTP